MSFLKLQLMRTSAHLSKSSITAWMKDHLSTTANYPESRALNMLERLEQPQWNGAQKLTSSINEWQKFKIRTIYTVQLFLLLLVCLSVFSFAHSLGRLLIKFHCFHFAIDSLFWRSLSPCKLASSTTCCRRYLILQISSLIPYPPVVLSYEVFGVRMYFSSLKKLSVLCWTI